MDDQIIRYIQLLTEAMSHLGDELAEIKLEISMVSLSQSETTKTIEDMKHTLNYTESMLKDFINKK